MVKIKGAYSISKAIAAAVASVLLAVAAVFMCACGSLRAPSPDITPHLISVPDASPVRPIDVDGREEERMPAFTLPLSELEMRMRIEYLYEAVVTLRKKPVFESDDPVKPIYDAAVKLLDTYVLNSWHDSGEKGEYNIVHTVHDYLIYYVEYDHAFYDSYDPAVETPENPAFDIDGVFLNKLAVCGGISRAANFLFAIEGIESVQVTGSYSGVLHAWNKVKVGGKWYNIDATADSANYTIDGDQKLYKQLSHGFFMLSDKTYETFSPNGAGGAHVFSGLQTRAADTDHSYYTDKMFFIGDEPYPCVVTDQQALNDIFAAIGKASGKIGKVELKLDFPEKVNVNNADVYRKEIAEAYSELTLPDFSVTEASRPYIRYPNGVYLFLIYK